MIKIYQVDFEDGDTFWYADAYSVFEKLDSEAEYYNDEFFPDRKLPDNQLRMIENMLAGTQLAGGWFTITCMEVTESAWGLITESLNW